MKFHGRNLYPTLLFITVASAYASTSLEENFNHLKSKNTHFSNLRLEVQNTSETQSAAWPCTYNAENESVQVTDKVKELSSELQRECLAQALSESRYAEVEEAWLNELGTQEVFVFDATQKRVVKKEIQNHALHNAQGLTLWKTFASKALLEEKGKASSDSVGRSIASVKKSLTEVAASLLK